MSATLTDDPLAEPSPEEIARMQAEMHEMYLEAEKTLARMDANRPEIDRLRAETEVILDSIQDIINSPEQLAYRQRRDQENAEMPRRLAEKDAELMALRLEIQTLRYSLHPSRTVSGLSGTRS